MESCCRYDTALLEFNVCYVTWMIIETWYLEADSMFWSMGWEL